MKNKKIFLVHIIVTMFLLGCGKSVDNTLEPNGLEQESSEEAKETDYYSIGDTVSGENVEIVLKSVNFTPSYVSGSGRTVSVKGYEFVDIEFSVKNVGKTPLKMFEQINGGKSSVLYDIVYIDYNDGYIFTVDKVVDDNGDEFYPFLGFFFSDENRKAVDDTSISDLPVLGDSVTRIATIMVPEEVATKDDTPLLIGFTIPGEEETETIIYKIR